MKIEVLIGWTILTGKLIGHGMSENWCNNSEDGTEFHDMNRLMILVVVGTSQGKITLFMEILAILIFKLAIRCRPLMMPCGKKSDRMEPSSGSTLMHSWYENSEIPHHYFYII